MGLCPRCIARFGFEDSNSIDPSPPSAPSTFVTVGENASLIRPVPHPHALSGIRLGTYELLEELGRGGMGVVYRARQVGLNRVVALKTILAGALARPADVDRFRAEAEAAAALRHPNLVPVHEIFEADGYHCYSMELVPGRNLDQITAGNPLPAEVAAQYIRKVSAAISHAHSHGILHRDLKPSNILVDQLGEPRVADFGLAKRLSSSASVTSSGQCLGSPQFLAPEQLSSRRGEVGSRTDVYSIGAVLYQLLVGRPPFDGATLEEVLLQVIDSEPAPPRQFQPRIPIDLETICLKCLEKEPVRRYASADDLIDDLDRFLRGEPTRARPLGFLARVGRWARRQPATAALAALLVLLASAGAVAWKQFPAWVADLANPGAGKAPSLAFSLSDPEMAATNWVLTVVASTNTAAQTADQDRTDGEVGRFRRIEWEVPGGSAVQGFHRYAGATYDPTISGRIVELEVECSAWHKVGNGPSTLRPALWQGGRRFLGPSQGVGAGMFLKHRFLRLRREDFALESGFDTDPGERPQFGPDGGAIQFGFAILDHDPARGHHSVTWVDDFGVRVFGPPAAQFPVQDDEFDEAGWTSHDLAIGDAREAATRDASTGHPAPSMRLQADLADGSNLVSVHLKDSAVYDPRLQGAVESVDILFELRMEPEAFGRNTYPSVSPVIVQNGRVFAVGNAVGAIARSEGGWLPFRFIGLKPGYFGAFLGPNKIDPSSLLDYSTNGAALRLGFSLGHNTAYHNARKEGYRSILWVDNVRLDVHRAGPP